MNVQPLIKTIKHEEQQFVCPMCAFAFKSRQAFEDHLYGCTGRGFQFGEAYVNKILTRDKDGILWIFRGESSNFAMVNGYLVQCNRGAASVSMSKMIMTVTDLREFSISTPEEAREAYNRVVTEIRNRIIDTVTEGCE